MTAQAFDETMIAVAAAEMRRMLGLVPWPAFEAQAERYRQQYIAAGGYPAAWASGRRTGRTTRDALAALARWRVESRPAIHVLGDRHVVRLVKDLARRLGLQPLIIDGDSHHSNGAPPPGGSLVLVDHHEATRRRRAR